MSRTTAFILIIGLFVALSWAYCGLSDEDDPLYVSLLFLVVTVQILTFYIPEERTGFYNSCLNVILASGGLLGMSWLFYTLSVASSGSMFHRLASWAPVFQWLDFGLSFLLVGFVSFLAILLVLGANGTNGRALGRSLPKWIDVKRIISMKSNIEQHPVFSICFVFTALLHVTYALGFALAFHDKAEGGLYVTPIERVTHVGELFLDGQTILVEDMNYDVRNNLEGVLRRHAGSPRVMRIMVGGAVQQSASGSMDGPQSVLTTHGAEAAIQWLGGGRLRADRDTRVEWIFNTTIKEEENGSASMHPFGREFGELLDGGRGAPSSGSTLDVLVALDESQRPPQLLDYIYFLLYTIVTTAYGDILPVSTFAKMVCAFANIFESFFTVVLFGAFLKFMGPWNPQRSRSSTISAT